MNRRSKLFLSTVLSAALALCIYFLVLAISKQNQHTFDLTKNQRNTLTQQSLDLLRRLDKPVKAWVFEADGRGRKEVESLMERYQKVNPGKFEYEINDVERRPTLAQELEVRTNSQAVLEFKGQEAGQRRERATNLEEAAITSALLKLSHSKERKVYFVQGHGERGLEQKDQGSVSEWKAALATEGFVSEPLSLVSEKEVPKDAAALILAGPTSAMLEGELKKVKDFLEAGGHLMLAAEMETPKQYQELVAEYGVELKDEVIIDEASALVNAEPVFAVGAVYSPTSPVTRDFKTNTLFRLARPVEKGAEKEGLRVDPLIKTPPSAYPVPLSEVVGKTQFAFTPDAEKAVSLGLAVAVTRTIGQPEPTETPAPEQPEAKPKEQRLLVFGDIDCFSNNMLALNGNRDLALNAVNWLAEADDQITIRDDESKSKPLVLENNQLAWIRLVSMVLVPLLVAVTGFVTASGRNNSR